MEETLALPLDEDATQDISTEPTEAGSLEVAGKTHKLFHGCNVIARQSRNSDQHADRLQKMQSKYSQFDSITAVFLPGITLSSEHAIICMELVRNQQGIQEVVAFVEDLESRNKTKVKAQGPFVTADPALQPGTRTRISSGSAVLFGGIEGVVRCWEPAAADKATLAAVDEDETLAIEDAFDDDAARAEPAQPAAAQAADTPAAASPLQPAAVTAAQGAPSPVDTAVDIVSTGLASPGGPAGDGRPSEAATSAHQDAAATQPQHRPGNSQPPEGDLTAAPAASNMQPPVAAGSGRSAERKASEPAGDVDADPLEAADGQAQAAALAFLEDADEDDVHIPPSPDADAANEADAAHVQMTLGHDDTDDVWPPPARTPSPAAAAAAAAAVVVAEAAAGAAAVTYGGATTAEVPPADTTAATTQDTDFGTAAGSLQPEEGTTQDAAAVDADRPDEPNLAAAVGAVDSADGVSSARDGVAAGEVGVDGTLPDVAGGGASHIVPAAAAHQADSDETRDSLGEDAEDGTTSADAGRREAAGISGGGWRHVKRTSAAEEAAHVNAPTASAVAPADVSASPQQLPDEPAARLADHAQGAPLLPTAATPPENAHNQVKASPASASGLAPSEGSPLISSSAVQAALDGAGAAAALFPATQTTQGRPSDASTVAPAVQSEGPEPAAQPSAAPADDSVQQAKPAQASLLQDSDGSAAGASPNSPEAATGAGAEAAVDAAIGSGHPQGAESPQGAASEGEPAPAWGTEAAASTLAPQPDADAASVQRTLAGGSPRHGEGTLEAADDLATLRTATGDSSRAEKAAAAPTKRGSRAKHTPKPKPAGKKAVGKKAASEGGTAATQGDRGTTNAVQTAKEQCPLPAPAKGTAEQAEKEDSPAPAPGLRDPARRRKPIKAASAEVEEAPVAPRRSSTPAEARVPRNGGRIAKRAQGPGCATQVRSPATDSTAAAPPAASGRKRKAVTPPPQQKEAASDASPDAAAEQLPTRRPPKRGRSRLANTSTATPEGSPEAPAAAATAAVPAGAAQRPATRRSTGTGTGATADADLAPRTSDPKVDSAAPRTRRTSASAQAASQPHQTAGTDQADLADDTAEAAAEKVSKAAPKRKATPAPEHKDGGPCTTPAESPPFPAGFKRASGAGAKTNAGKRPPASTAVQSPIDAAEDEGASTASAAKRRRKAQPHAAGDSEAATAAASSEPPEAVHAVEAPSSAEPASKRGRSSKSAALAASAATDSQPEASGKQTRKAGAPAKKGMSKAAAQAPPARSSGSTAKAAAQVAEDVLPLGRRKAGPDVVVRFAKSVGDVQRKAQTAIIKQLGGRVTEDDADFTHLVVQPRANRSDVSAGFVKSFTSLVALASGRPIVDLTWVRAAGDAKAFSSPLANATSFLLTDKVAEKEHGFCLRKSYQAAHTRLLLQDSVVLLTPAMRGEEKDRGAGVQALIEAAGGQVVKAAKDLPKAGSCLVIGSEKGQKGEQNTLKGKVPAGTRLYGRTQLLDAILKQDHTFGSSGDSPLLA
eukprot:CAMPEP_0206137334 /NCGR_PEP_ID=MMETSP1473-20131121/2476_1 /ASSEMBLY_ACC=CAM_ASM_001109 /TAXON_ID=1461547 /ORGANISM="Stichococcus sp, Strain RCC1054" /LENGTH=1516 /DNA_ID=CAMNT_0053530373 /DNA_START=187 /DNA_END=4737 /DNA_ORIENTATION=-